MELTKPPKGLAWRSNTFFIIVTVGIGAFTDMFLYGIIVPVLPFLLKDRIHLPESQIQGTTSALFAAFAAASIATSPIAGFLSDKFSQSRHVPFVLGLIFLALGTVLLAVGQTIPVLAFARILQGASGGVVWTIGLAIIIETVGHENLGKAMGTVYSIVSVAALFGPAAGGTIYARTGYKGVFGLSIGLIGLDLVLRTLMIEKKIAAKYATATSQAGPSFSREHSEETPLLTEIAKTHEQYRLSQPKSSITKAMPILLLLHDPSLLTAMWMGFVQSILLSGFDATVPLVAYELFGFDSMKAGLLFLPLPIADLLLGPLYGWCVDRYGTKLPSTFGLMWLVPTLVLLRLVTSPTIIDGLDQSSHIALYATLLGLNGVGVAAVNAPCIVEAGNVVEKYYKANGDIFEQPPFAQLYGLSSMVFSGGNTLGPVMAGLLREKIGYGNMNAVLAGFCGFTAALSAVYVGRVRKEPDENGEDTDIQD